MVAASLLGFYREGWEPMTPIDTASKADKRGGQVRTINIIIIVMIIILIIIIDTATMADKMGGQVRTIINQSFILLSITIVRC